MKRFRLLPLLCLFTYLWAATGIADTLLIHTLIAEHEGGHAIVFEPTPNEQLFVHHVGHRDAHEPNAIDHEDDQNQATKSTVADGHGDHVLKLNGTGFTDTLPANHVKLGKIPLTAFAVSTPATVYAAQIPTQLTAAQPPPIRNSRIAFVQLTQLRI